MEIAKIISIGKMVMKIVTIIPIIIHGIEKIVETYKIEKKEIEEYWNR